MLSGRQCERNHQALFAMEVLTGVVPRFATRLRLRAPVRRAVGIARAAAGSVIFVRVASRSGYPVVSRANCSFAALAHAGASLTEQDQAAAAIHPALALASDDIIVTKRRVNAFTGSALDLVLHRRRIQQLVQTATATSGVVLSTVRATRDRDGQLTARAGAGMIGTLRCTACWRKNLSPPSRGHDGADAGRPAGSHRR